MDNTTYDNSNDVQTIQQSISTDILGNVSADNALMIRDGMNDANEYLSDISAIKDIGSLYRYFDSSNSHDTFISIAPMFKTIDGRQAIMTVNDNNVIVPVTTLLQGSQMVWVLTTHDYRHKSIDNIELGSFDTIQMTKTAIHAVLDFANDTVKIVSMSTTGRPNAKQQAIYSNVGIESLQLLFANMYKSYSNMVKNGQKKVVRLSRDKVINDNRNTIVKLYKAQQSDKRK